MCRLVAWYAPRHKWLRGEIQGVFRRYCCFYHFYRFRKICASGGEWALSELAKPALSAPLYVVSVNYVLLRCCAWVKMGTYRGIGRGW